MPDQPLDLDAIEALTNAATKGPWFNDSHEIYAGPHTDIPAMNEWIGETCDPSRPDHGAANAALAAWARDGVPALVAEIRQLREQLSEIETYAQGCDGEGCVLPHSSWCERAKAYAADHDGCTCGRPWENTPQPHSGHCWIVHPPHPEVDAMRAEVRRLAEQLRQARQQLARETRAHNETANERDRAADMADKLAAVIAPEHVIGEHTGMNDPWQNALDHAAEKTYVAPGCACQTAAQTAPAAVSSV